MANPDIDEIMAVLADAAAAAAAETLPLFRAHLDIDNKHQSGFDPVTQADRRAETAIRDVIEKVFPDHAILGEEHEAKTTDSLYQWIIDPIDGTRAFIAGLPVWGTLIGLYHDGRPLAGVMSQPFTGETYFGSATGSTLLRGDAATELRTSTRSRLEDGIVMSTDPTLFADARKRTAFERVRNAARLTRYGADCYAFTLVAAGHVDVVIETGLQPYDIAALIPIIEGAGGLVTSWTGGDAAQGGDVVAAANPAIHAETLVLLA